MITYVTVQGDLPDVYAEAQGHTVPETDCRQFRKILIHMLCNTFDTKSLLILPITVLPLYIMMDAVYM